jgi:hypothetical protein
MFDGVRKTISERIGAISRPFAAEKVVNPASRQATAAGAGLTTPAARGSL